MTLFLRILSDTNKAEALLETCTHLRSSESDPRAFEVEASSFDAVPGKPFAYWVSESARQIFSQLPALEDGERTAKQGLATADDFRFVRLGWEVTTGDYWFPFAKGGKYSPYYSDIFLGLNWSNSGAEICNLYKPGSSKLASRPQNIDLFFRPGLTWPLRTNGLSMRVLPAGCIFSHKGPTAFTLNNDPNELLALACLLNSRSFGLLVSMQLARTELAQSYEVGLIQQTPIPVLTKEQRTQLAQLARRAWSLKRSLDTTTEISHAFVLPAALRGRLGSFDPVAMIDELSAIQTEIDELAFALYGFAESDRLAVNGPVTDAEAEDEEEKEVESEILPVDGLLSWVVGVFFGRFDPRLATGERSASPEPEPFDPLLSKSPGMLPDGVAPFHIHNGILVDDPGHPHDLVHGIDAVLQAVNESIATDLRRWLQRDFFAFHLKAYSKSRRQAPIYWPLATPSGSYTLWIYYPSLNNQTLYSCINDFVEPKLKTVTDDLNSLRNKSDRSSAKEKELSNLTDLELELKNFHDELLHLAPRWKPNLNDGVQITAAPLWKLFQFTPWQKKLKTTWNSLEKGDYDWANLAYHLWPERVLRKCHSDRSLAIAHNVENDFWKQVEVQVIRRGKETEEVKIEWHQKKLSEADLIMLIKRKMEEVIQ